MARWRFPRWGGVATLAGAAMLFGSVGMTGWETWAAARDCPAKPRSSSLAAYVTQASFRLGGPLCLTIDRERFFATERMALELRKKAVEEAKAALKQARDDRGTDAQAAADAVKNAQTWVDEANAALAQLPQRRKIFLFVDDVKIPVEGRDIEIWPGDNSKLASETIQLRGADNASSDEGKAWRRILSGPTDYGMRKVKIGVAVSEGDDKPPVMRVVEEGQIQLQVFDLWLLLLGSVGLVLLAAGITKLGWKTGMLRDGGAATQFSLGRVQMAWWLVLAIGGFLFIWLVSGQWKGVVTSGVIALLGISASTGVASRLIDSNSDPSSPPAGSGSSAAGSKGFWTDLVDDGDGAALHRIQLIAWTVILGAVFAWTVVWTFGFPDFDTNLLLLVGIAGGTYLGFKFQEPDTGHSSPP